MRYRRRRRRSGPGFPGDILDGILLIDKPGGMTSWDVVSGVRRRLAPRSRRRGRNRYRCGHAGTLDPLATGLLLVLCGSGSRLSQFLLGHDKSYHVRICFGIATDSLDADGQITSTHEPRFTDDALHAAMSTLRGDISQTPPAISAIKHQGRPLYEIARSGDEMPEITSRDVHIAAFDLLEELAPALRDDGHPVRRLEFRVQCSSGTYIRSLAADLAEKLGTLAHVETLRRESVGPFRIEDALAYTDDLERDDVLAAMVPPAAALADLPSLVLTDEQSSDIRLGRQPDPAWASQLVGRAKGSRAAYFTMLDRASQLVAVGELIDTGPDTPQEPRLVSVFPKSKEPTNHAVDSAE
jgi:tRNA pseudouridine55 synthase